MGINFNEQHKPDETDQPIIKKALEPVLVASKRFYQTNPKETLELFITGGFVILTALGEIISNLPWTYYFAFSIWILVYTESYLKIKKKFQRKDKLHARQHNRNSSPAPKRN